MPSALPDLMDRLIELLEGRSTTTSVRRQCPTERFRHVSFDADYTLGGASSAPYPFDIQDDGETEPNDVPSTLSPDQVWYGCRLLVRVAYADQPHDQLELAKTIARDRFAIRRCLGDPDSWGGVTGFSRVKLGDSRIVPAVIPGATDQEPEPLQLLTVPVELVYMEDHSS